MGFNYKNTFLLEFEDSLLANTLNGNSVVYNMSAYNVDNGYPINDIEFADSSNGKRSLAMKNGSKYSIVYSSSSIYFGPYPNTDKGVDWVFDIDFFSSNFGSSRRRALAGQYQVVLQGNEYVIINNQGDNKFGEFFIFEESTGIENMHSMHLWIRVENVPDQYYKFKTEDFAANKWINFVIHFTQPAIPSSTSTPDPIEPYSLKFFINCEDLQFSSYGVAPPKYSNNTEYLNVTKPINVFNFSLNDRIFGTSSSCAQLSSLVNEISCFNRRGDESEDRAAFSEREVFNTYNYGMAFTILNNNKITNNKFIIKSTAMSTVRVLSTEGSSEGQYLGLSDGRLLESKEAVWQYSKLLNNQMSLEQIDVIAITPNSNIDIVPGSGIKFTGYIVGLE